MSSSTIREPRDLAGSIERHPSLPDGAEERFSGYGVMGLPFASGHILAFRRFPASSVGPGYTSVWHRAPSGRWTFYSDVAPELACARFFGAAVDRAVVDDVALRWTGPRSFTVTVGRARLTWDVHLAPTPRSRLLNALAGALPEPLWRDPRALGGLGAAAGRALGLGRLCLTGAAPNGQRFRATPRLVWPVDASTALLDGETLGPLDPAARQTRLGDFWIPRRGVFVIGQAFFWSPSAGG